MYDLFRILASLSALFPYKSGPYPVVTKINYAEEYRFVTLGDDTKPGVNLEIAKKAIELMNRAVASGCLRDKILNHKFKSLESVTEGVVRSPAEAYELYTGGAPYSLDLRWYSKRITEIIGYTYAYRDKPESETRIWTNRLKVIDARMYAGHLAHELSHQARAGGFTHKGIADGSFPYEVGDLMEECL